ncbi:MAG: hypothetical protein AAF394_18005 [Planctomycetota bacterium]
MNDDSDPVDVCETNETSKNNWELGLAMGLSIAVSLGIALDNWTLGILLGCSMIPAFAMSMKKG